jgi:hypothetical protein
LHDLAERLRRESRDFPLSIVVYGWASAEARNFLAALRPELADEDAVWLVPSETKNGSLAYSELEQAVVLRPESRQSHQRALANLIGDTVFFSAQSPRDVQEVVHWGGRARAVIVQQSRPQTAAILRATEPLQVPSYVWDEKTLEEI